MSRLFWRIFVAFWSATILIILSIAWITTHHFETERIPGLEITRLQASLDEQLIIAARELSRPGATSRAQLQDIAEGDTYTIFLLDGNGHDVLGRPVPTHVLELARADSSAVDTLSERMRRRSVVAVDGRPFVAVAVFAGSRFGPLFDRRPFRFWLPIGIALSISALFSVLLAAYVVMPLERIRASTRRFAQGDLDARVGTLRLNRSYEISTLAGEFDTMAARIKVLVENNRRLVRDVSHELRSPLARLRVALELARGGDAARQTASFDRIEAEADRLDEMLSQAIELSRLETITTTVRGMPLALDELLDDVIGNASYEGVLQRRKVVFSEREALTVPGSRDALSSAFENVVRNALAYTVANTTVEVRLHADRTDPSMAHISVRDHGPGVAESELVRIFEPFYRTDVARARASGGTGLGLAIARSAIENHGGTIRAHNAAGGGLEIAINLPMAVSAFARPTHAT